MNLLEQLLTDALGDKPVRIKLNKREPKPVNQYIESLKDIERCVEYLIKEDGKIAKWRYDENISVLKEAFNNVLKYRWYKD